MDIIFFIVVTVFVGLRLFSVLGRKDFDHPEHAKAPIVTPNQHTKTPVIDQTDIWQEAYGKALTTKIKAVRKVDATFLPEEFTEGAKLAFDYILKSYAAGDKEQLRDLLDDAIYNDFEATIDERASQKLTHEIVLVSEPEITLKDIQVQRSTCFIDVHIESEQIAFSRDTSGKVVEGDASQVDKITDEWTFTRNLKSSNPNWTLLQIKS